MQNMVSVIIPVYNGEKYIAEALESVFNQTYSNYEVVVVDDGSTDGSEQIIDQYSDKVKFIKQTNSGPAGARNNGIKNSIGEYIAFLDCDDIWVPEKLQEQVNRLENNKEFGLVYSDFGKFDEHGVIEQSASQSRNLFMPSGNIFPYLFFDPLCWTSTVLVKRSCLDEIGIFDEDKKIQIAEDYDLWLRISRKFEIGYLDSVTAMYRQAPNSLTTKGGRGFTAETYMLSKTVKAFPEILDEIGRRNVNKRFSVPYFEFGYFQSLSGMKREARKNFLKAISFWPTNFKYWANFFATFLSQNLVSRIRRIKGKFITSSPSFRASVGNVVSSNKRN